MSVEPNGLELTEQARVAADAVWQEKVLPGLSQHLLSNGKPSPEPKGLWQNRLSPPFPADWSASGAGPSDMRFPEADSMVFYAYSVVTSSSLSDGERIGAIWGEVILDPAKNFTPEVRLLPSATVEPTVQGIRPISPEEAARLDFDVFKRLYRVLDYRLLSAMADKSQIAAPKELKAYYCQWIDLNGTVTKQIAERQGPFLDWLACGKK